MDHVNVLIIGAGISGVGVACHLKMESPDQSFTILEGRERLGGTWDLFKYPGIRSDSDMFTFGYRFKPWIEDNDIATADSILKYLHETVDEYDLSDKIKYNQKVTKVAWDSAKKLWVADVEDTSGGKNYQISCNFLVTGTGYYKYDQGYLPQFEGYDDFKGTIVHPQHWPEDLDYTNKRVVVIGSGATAVTLIPNMCKDTAHITMLQRSPTYMISRPAADPIAKFLRKWLPIKLAYRMTRLKNMLMGAYIFRTAKTKPEQMRAYLEGKVKEEVGPDVDVAKHFSPTYNPWDQRLCLVPDNDLFHAVRDGEASVVTDTIESFVENGIKLTSGEVLEADIIVTATGLDLQFLGGIDMFVDGEKQNPGALVSYRGMMFGNIPNMINVVGYTNASWTLKVDLTAEYLCRLLNHMKANHLEEVYPKLEDGQITSEPIVGLASNYILRKAAELPKQGTEHPWRNKDNYLADRKSIRRASFDDGILHFG
ncbi:cyclohexanone monooxygenase [Kordiimonas sediminis]|uniref:Cyclohexanone monooxygenase n=1 Tax=Kordiimonas sediminis TaxID=1735581 RepID=A0A919AUG9_9PROT|nr:NAD(P)/FAD-dependent oxidoreductase [Kordiimonas sediminis]GHF24096.1 cyclohexanone monooxygenase [Kordiimonas sediminis]